MIRKDALDSLHERNAQPGETAQYGWFIFRVVDSNGSLDVETLDFQRMASFTKDFSVVERIHRDQLRILRQEAAGVAICNLQQYALVSKSYRPEADKPFLSRDTAVDGNDSGWFVGIERDPLDVQDQSNFVPKSLYEISIHDRRFLPFWLLPPGFLIQFEGDTPRIVRPQQDACTARR